MELTQQQRDFLLPYAYDAAVRAGAAILALYGEGESVELKSDDSPLTEADRKAHDTIRTHLSRTHVPLLSEEGREMLYDERRGWDLFWMVDPLDGTREFLKRNGEFTVNIALMADNKPVLSVVYVPYLGRIYFADRLSGAFRKDGVSADVDSCNDMVSIMASAVGLPTAEGPNDPPVVAVSRSHNNEETTRYIDILRKDYPDLKVMEQGSSYKFCLLAEGGVDCYFRTTNTSEWDTAAGELILEMAGGRTRSLPDAEPLEYNKLTLLNPHFVCMSKFMAGFRKS